MQSLLSDVFDLRAIKLNLDGKTKEMVFVELIDAIAALHPQCDRAELFTAIRKREEKMNTGIACGAAIPHAFCKGIDNIAGAIGISQQGIDYGALNDKPVNVVFLLAINDHAKENHLSILNLIFDLAQSEAIAVMKNAKTAEDIHAILSRIRYDVQ